MKTLKKIKSKKILAIIVLGVILSLNATDASAKGIRRYLRQHGIEFGNNNNGNQGPNRNNSVGAPLDGGIITILLGGAGVAYFARKRKKTEE